VNSPKAIEPIDTRKEIAKVASVCQISDEQKQKQAGEVKQISAEAPIETRKVLAKIANVRTTIA
jgi:hypothetical protein